MRNAFRFGIILLLVSAPALWFLGVELWTEYRAYKRYHVQQRTGTNYDYRSAEFHGHRVVLSEDLASIEIDDRDHSSGIPADGRKSILIMTVEDLERGEERLAIIQCVKGENYPDDTRYRVLFVRPDGTVSEEWFGYSERHEPGYRTMLAKRVHPSPIGFRTNVLQFPMGALTTIPVIYPCLTAAVGLVLSAIGGIFLLYRRG